jgi:uncharacterized phage-associated protein
MINSITLSKYVLAKINGKTNHLKLQKIIYYIQAWHLAIFNEPIIRDDFQAWLHGPVSRKIWNEYRDKSVLYDNLSISKTEGRKIIKKVEEQLKPDQVEMINDVIHEYGSKSGYTLEALTHSEPPWKKAREGYGRADRCEEIIPKEEIKKYFQSMLGEANA